MKLSYHVATPEVKILPSVTSYQGDLETSFKRLHEVGYEGAELMVCDPCKIDKAQLKALARKYSLEIPMVCTGEVFGQGAVSFSSTDPEINKEAVKRAFDAVDVAAEFGTQINIGRLRGGLVWGADPEGCKQRIFDAFCKVADYAKPKGVRVALEPVNELLLNYINSTQDGMAMVDKVARDNFKIMIDTNHMWISDIDPIKSVYEAKGYFTHVHLVDTNRLWPGNLKFDFPSFIKALNDIGYDEWCSVEVFSRPDQDTALECSYKYLAPLMGKA